jgi:hypothetical protein
VSRIKDTISIAAQRIEAFRAWVRTGGDDDRGAQAHQATGQQSEVATVVDHVKRLPRLLSRFGYAIVELNRRTINRRKWSSRRKNSNVAYQRTRDRIRKACPELAVSDGGKKPLLLKLPVTIGILFASGIAFELLAGNNQALFMLIGIPIRPSYLMALGATLVVVTLGTAISHFLAHGLVRNAKRKKGEGSKSDRYQGPIVRNQFNRSWNLALLLTTIALAIGVVSGYGEVRASVIRTDAQSRGQKISKAELDKETLAFRILVSGEIAALVLVSLVLDPLPNQVLRRHRKAANRDYRGEQFARKRENRAYRRMVKLGAQLEVHSLTGPAKLRYVELKNMAAGAARGYGLKDPTTAPLVVVGPSGSTPKTVLGGGKSIAEALLSDETVADEASEITITPASNSNHAGPRQPAD